MNIDCIVIEDEPMAMHKLEAFIREIPFLNLTGLFDSSLEGLNFLITHHTDLVFLDIQMDKLGGIDLLQTLTKPPKVIITTAFSQYAIKGFELMVSDYLLKPYSFERFVQAVNKVHDELKSIRTYTPAKEKPDVIFVRTAYQITRVNLSDILYIEGMKDYLGIVTPATRIMCLQNFSSIMDILPSADFVRVHKSFIVALDKIDHISNHRIQIGERLIPISNTYHTTFYSALEQYRSVL